MITKSQKGKVVTENFVYGVVTKSVSAAENRLNDRIDKLEEKMDKRFDTVMEHIDGLAKGFKKFDEEHSIHSETLRTHGDRIEKLEETVFKPLAA